MDQKFRSQLLSLAAVSAERFAKSAISLAFGARTPFRFNIKTRANQNAGPDSDRGARRGRAFPTLPLVEYLPPKGTGHPGTARPISPAGMLIYMVYPLRNSLSRYLALNSNVFPKPSSK